MYYNNQRFCVVYIYMPSKSASFLSEARSINSHLAEYILLHVLLIVAIFL